MSSEQPAKVKICPDCAMQTLNDFIQQANAERDRLYDENELLRQINRAQSAALIAVKAACGRAARNEFVTNVEQVVKGAIRAAEKLKAESYEHSK